MAAAASPAKRPKASAAHCDVSVVPFAVPGGTKSWPNNLRIANEHVELIVTLDVGPRIICFRRLPDGANVFKTYGEQIGGGRESSWMIRGGHRLWAAPENDLTYALDNDPVKWEMVHDEVVIRAQPASGVGKELGITLGEDGKVRVRHKLANVGSEQALNVAPWALTVCRPGGIELIPQPPLGQHPKDLLPNRVLVLWPYTDFSDVRLGLGTHFIRLKQSSSHGPIKLGLAHKENWVAYAVGDDLFTKRFDFDAERVYPDGGCNFETFTNEEMLEVETLGPLQSLGKGQASKDHIETWILSKLPSSGVDLAKDEEVKRLIGNSFS